MARRREMINRAKAIVKEYSLEIDFLARTLLPPVHDETNRFKQSVSKSKYSLK
tara:strand:+ start:708 stop:866 length:159 start_codon:yes stop_codon:yes gene_type:complete